MSYVVTAVVFLLVGAFYKKVGAKLAEFGRWAWYKMNTVQVPPPKV